MSGIRTYQSLGKLVTRLRDDLNEADLVLLYAYNRTGKTRLSMEFKNSGKRKTKKNPTGTPDTLHAAGDRGRRLDLDDQVDGAHVDAQLQAARGDDGR
mgnify:CR=1 FL=1